MKFELFIALRYLRAKRKQTMVSVISIISAMGITAGVMSLVIALSLSTGFKEVIQNKIVGATSHINLLSIDNTPLSNYQELLNKIGQVPGVIGSAPAIFSQVFITSAIRSQGAVLKGISPAYENEVSDFISYLVEGDPQIFDKHDIAAESEASASLDNLAIGKEMARKMGVKVGDTLKVFQPTGRSTPLETAASHKTFRVSAIFESGLWDLDSNWAYANIESVRHLLSFSPGSASVLQFKTDNLEDVRTIADKIHARAGAGFITTTWIDINKPLFSALKLEKIVLFLTISLIVFVASLNIVTTLIMMVLEKQRDIAIFTAMGATAKTMQRIFMLQGLIIGLLGIVLGSALGIGVSWVLNTYRVIKLQAEIHSISYVPFHVRVSDVLLISGTALLISYLATIYPARHASSLDPVEVLRFE